MTSHDSETPAEGQQVITACAFIHQNFEGVEKVFLAQRAETKKFLPGVHELPGGHINYGENPVMGLKREIQEELSTDVSIGDPFFVFTYVNELKQSHSIEIVYFATLITDPSNITLNPKDHSSFGWYAENDLASAVRNVNSEDDPEFQAILKGFALLRGIAHNF